MMFSSVYSKIVKVSRCQFYENNAVKNLFVMNTKQNALYNTEPLMWKIVVLLQRPIIALEKNITI